MTSVRQATSDDAEAITAIWLEAWRGAYRGIVPDEAIARRTDEAAVAYWQAVLPDPQRSRLVLVAELPDRGVVGFAQAGVPEPDEPGYETELWKLYISPNAQRQGVGRALMRAMAEHLLRDGVTTMCLRAFVGNRAADFYTRMGGQVLREEPYEILGSVAPTIIVRLARPDDAVRGGRRAGVTHQMALDQLPGRSAFRRDVPDHSMESATGTVQAFAN